LAECEVCVDAVVTMSDSYGDGWNGIVFHIGAFTYTLATGASATVTACLVEGTHRPPLSFRCTFFSPPGFHPCVIAVPSRFPTYFPMESSCFPM
jgi:hypothetical protein